MADKPTAQHVLSVLRDAQEEAESALPQFQEVSDLLAKEEYTRALGAFDALEERVHYVGMILKRFARHTGLTR
jgi:hypothetical protein